MMAELCYSNSPTPGISPPYLLFCKKTSSTLSGMTDTLLARSLKKHHNMDDDDNDHGRHYVKAGDGRYIAGGKKEG